MADEPKVAEQPKTEEPKPEESQTYTKAEIDALLTKTTAEAEAKAWQKYQGIQRTVSDKDKRIKELESKLATPATSNQTLTGLIDEVGKLAESGDPTAQARLAKLRMQLDTEQARINQEAQFRKQQEIVESKRDEITAKIVSAGFDPNGDEVSDVWDAFDLSVGLDGKFERADRKLDKILKAQKKVSEPPKETEEQLKARIEREILEKHKLTTPERTTPSGAKGQLTPEMIARMSPDERFARRKEIDALPIQY